MSKLVSKRSFSLRRTKQKTANSARVSLKTRIDNRTAHWNFKKIIGTMVTIGVLVGVVSSWYWYQNIFMNEERRLYAALENSMATPSVVRTLSEGGSGNQVVQQFRFHFAPQRVIENNVAYTERSATTNTRVVTEGIIFPTAQYLRYAEYSSENQSTGSTNIDSLLGVWASDDTLSEEDAKLTYLSEQVSLILFGNFPSEQRQKFLDTIKDQQIYSIDYETVREESLDNEDVLVYGVRVKLKQYATLLNESFRIAGYGEFPPLDPANYREDAIVNAQFTVRKRDNVFVGVNFGGRDERYSGYGVVKSVERPEATRSIEELQEEVQQLFEAQQSV